MPEPSAGRAWAIARIDSHTKEKKRMMDRHKAEQVALFASLEEWYKKFEGEPGGISSTLSRKKDEYRVERYELWQRQKEEKSKLTQALNYDLRSKGINPLEFGVRGLNVPEVASPSMIRQYNQPLPGMSSAAGLQLWTKEHADRRNHLPLHEGPREYIQTTRETPGRRTSYSALQSNANTPSPGLPRR